MRAAGAKIISFGAGEPDFPTPAHICQAAIAAIQAGDTRYPAPVAGKNLLRDAIVEYLARYCDVQYKQSEIIATVGAKDALFYAFASLLDPGDEVIIPKPYWVSYPDQVRLAEGVPVFVHDPDSDMLKVGAREIERAISPRTRALVLNSPNNPSGAVYSHRELLDIADLLRGREILVISDEIYHRLVFGDARFTCFAALPGMKEQTLTVNGASKTFAMTGWRLGYGAGPKWLIDAMTKLQGQTTSGPSSFVQTAAAAALRGPSEPVETMRAAYERRGTLMAAELNAIAGVRCPTPSGAFYCFPNVADTFGRFGVADADQWADRVLEEAHVALVSGVAFGAPAHVRLSYSTSDADIAEGLTRLKKLLK